MANLLTRTFLFLAFLGTACETAGPPPREDQPAASSTSSSSTSSSGMRVFIDEDGRFVTPTPGDPQDPAEQRSVARPTPKVEQAPGGGIMIRLDEDSHKHGRAGSPE